MTNVFTDQEKFMVASDQTVNRYNEEQYLLYLRLIREEFNELQVAHADEDRVEQLDALLDLQYVLSGAVHEHGFGGIFNIAFEEVHSSNMSKADDDREDAWITGDKYLLSEDEVRTRFEEINGKFVTYRQEDNKVLKSHKYRPAQLAQFLK